MALVSRAVSAAVAVAQRHAPHRTDPLVLHDRSNVLVHLRPLPVVARVAATTSLVRGNPAEWLGADVALATHLHDRGAPVVPPSDRLPPGPHTHDGMTLTFWQYVPHSPADTPEPAAVAVMLAELHEAMRSFSGELSTVGPLRDVTHILDRMVRHGTLTGSVLANLREEADRLRAELAGMAVQPVHGDAHPGNLMSTEDGLLWTDFEDAWRGPVAWDLACLRNASRLDGLAALAAYPDPPSEAELRPCEQARALQSVVWGFAIALRFPERTADAHTRLNTWLRTHSDRAHID